MTGGRAAGSGREQPPRRSTWWTVECGRPTSSASRRGLQPVRRRSSQIRCSSAAGTCLGLVFGRLERSCRQASDARSAGEAARQRTTQPWTVDFETFAQAAAWANVSPSSTTRRTISHRPSGVWRALGCGTPGLLEGVSLDTHTLSAGPDYLTPFGTSLGTSASASTSARTQHDARWSLTTPTACIIAYTVV